MRILLINAFHYLKGGVERTYLDESRWLSAAGHEVGHLATRDPRNLPSPTAAYFAPAADYGEGAPAAAQVAQLGRAIWSRPAEACAARLVKAFAPDIAHVHAPSRYLTPSVLRPLERAGVPVVMTLHDFKPWCTNRIQFAHGAPCERCRGGHHVQALFTSCVQDSRLKSAVGTIEAYTHDRFGAYRAVRAWLAPSAFVLAKAVEWGVPHEQLRLLPHGVEPNAGGSTMPDSRTEGAESAAVARPETPYAFIAGRLSVEKGVRLLPALAMRLAPTPLLVAGDGPLRAWLESQMAALPNLRVLGHRPDAELAALRAGAAVVLVPSLFYEHFCYAAAEAMLDGRAVVASRIGAIPELVEHDVTGLLAAPGDAAALAEAALRLLQDPAWAAELGAAGRARVLAVGDPARHVAALLEIYREAVQARAEKASA
jgi:glycosyltransferase involved in cell wall biosynthesis